MTTLLFANNAQATLASTLTNVATTANLSAGTGVLFPSPSAGEGFKITFSNAPTPTTYEICLCTSRTGDTLTIVRGQEGTTAAAWAIGDFAGMFPTEGTMEELIQIDQFQKGRYSIAGSVAGTANAITATLVSNLNAVQPGMSIALTAGAANTGETTLNLTVGVTATGAIPVVKFGNVPLLANDIPGAGYPLELTYSSTYTAWVLQNPAASISAPIISGSDYAADTGSANTYTATYAPAIGALTNGLKLRFKAANASTGASTFAPNGLTAHPILTQLRFPISAGLIAANSEVELTYDISATSWIMTTPGSDIIASGSLNTGGDTNITVPANSAKTLRLTINGCNAGTNYSPSVQYNADTGANYGWGRIITTLAASATRGAVTTNGIGLFSSADLISAGAPNAFDCVLTIANPNSVNNYKPATIDPHWVPRASDGAPELGVGESVWRSTTAISSIQILLRGSIGVSPTGSTINATSGTWTLQAIN